MVKDRTNFDLKKIAVCAVQDAAAKSVARVWDPEVETCDMHGRDKVGASAVGRLVQKYGRGGFVNLFPAGKALEKKLNAQAKHFRLFTKTVTDSWKLLGLPTRIIICQQP